MAVKNNIPRKPAGPQKSGLGWIVLIGVIFAQLLIHTWVRTESTQTILRISTAKEEHAQKISYNRALSVERERLKSDERITRIARTRLNLSEDTREQTIYFAGEEI